MELANLHTFFEWILDTRDTVKSRSSLQTYWNTLCLVRTTLTGAVHVDFELRYCMRNVLEDLEADYELKTGKSPKPIMRIEDEVELLRTLWSSPEVQFNHERERVQLALMIQIAGISGNRPEALRQLRYRDVKFSLLSSGAGSRPNLDITFPRTKSYRGLKPANTFPIPEIPGDHLLLCPHVLMLSLIFADGAFAAPSLTGPEILEWLHIPSGRNELALPFAESMSDLPVFRRSIQTKNGYEVAPDQLVGKDWFRSHLRKLGAITGFQVPIGPYSFRRGCGEALNNSDLINESQRNLILQHRNSAVFQESYLSRYITQDVQAVYRGLGSQAEVIRAASGISRTIDRGCPRQLRDEEWTKVNKHPEIKLIKRRLDAMMARLRSEHVTMPRAQLEPLFHARGLLRREYRSKRREVTKSLLRTARAEHGSRQAVADIEAQVSKTTSIPADVSVSVLQGCISGERQQALGALEAPSPASDQQTPQLERRRRTDAVYAVIVVTRRREIRKYHSRMRRTMEVSTIVPNIAEAFRVICSPTQCIFCLGDPQLGREDRMRTFKSRHSLSKHWKACHLKFIGEGPIPCPHPKCTESLQHVQHLQLHASKVHGTPT